LNDELESIWKDAVVAEFKELSLHLPGGTEENQKNLSQHRQQGTLCHSAYFQEISLELGDSVQASVQFTVLE
jgi:hypothetical protein